MKKISPRVATSFVTLEVEDGSSCQGWLDASLACSRLYIHILLNSVPISGFLLMPLLGEGEIWKRGVAMAYVQSRS